MTNRVVLGAFDGTYVLRVSRPGFNVLSTSLTPKQLAFDSRWSEAGNVFMEGSFAGAANNEDTTINFGTTFSQPPVVVLRAKQNASDHTYTFSNQFTVSGQRSIHPELIVTTSSFRIIYNGGLAFPGIPLEARTIYYSVYRNFYG